MASRPVMLSRYSHWAPTFKQCLDNHIQAPQKAPNKGALLFGAPGRITPGFLPSAVISHIVCSTLWASLIGCLNSIPSDLSGHQQKALIWKIVPDDFLFRASCPAPLVPFAYNANVKNRSRRFFRTKWRTTQSDYNIHKKAPPKIGGAFLCMARLEGFEPPTARFVDAKSKKHSFNNQ